MKKFIFVIAILFSTSVYATAIDDAKAVLDALSAYGPNPKVLSNAQMLSIVDKFNAANGFSNPWDEEDNPDEFAAWPTNLEKATFFLERLGGEIRSDIRNAAAREYDASAAAAREAALQAAEDEL